MRLATSYRNVVLALALALLAQVPASPAQAADPPTVVRFDTPLGSFEVRLFPDEAPITVANFLKYVRDGDFVDSFIHRSVPGFVIQGGGFVFRNDGPVAIATDPPIHNEFGRSNVRGTIAMAKQGGNPDSATSQWFINLANNAAILDGQNGGFTVFGEVIGDGMTVVDALAAVPIFNAGNPFSEIPLRDYTVGNPITSDNLLFTQISETTTSAVPSLLLRRSTNHSWFSYRLSVDGDKADIREKGSVRLTRSAAFETASRADFDGDGEPDVLLRNPVAARGTEAWTLATLVGKRILDKGDVTLATGSEWDLVAVADFDGDRNADALFRNNVDGTWKIYVLRGPTVAATGQIPLSSDLDDRFAGFGDFDGDGRNDILLRRANGTWLVYLLNGTAAPRNGRPKLPHNARSSLASLADLDGDGTTDALFRDDDGSWHFFGFDGTKVKKGKGDVALPEDTDFALVDLRDFNGDGTSDALLRHADGTWWLATLDGPDVLAEGAPALTDDPDYGVVSTDDFDGDGGADLLLRHADGDWLLYTIDGTRIRVRSTIVPKLSKSKTWVPQTD